MDPNIVAFLISLSAGMSWDAMKVFLGQKPDSHEKLFVDAIASAMENFYDHRGFSYDETTVMEQFLSSAREWRDLKWKLRNVVEYTANTQITDEEFKTWVEVFEKKYPFGEHPFTDRDRMRKRIMYKLDDREVHNHGPFEEYVLGTIKGFNSSWKQEFIDLFEKQSIDCSFAKEPESCDSIQHFFVGAATKIDKNRLTKEEDDLINKTLRNPHYKKVQIIAGTSGSGKTHFVQMYSEAARKMLLRGEKVAASCEVELSTIQNLYKDITSSLKQFLEVEYNTLVDYSKMLDAIGINICFVIENVNSILNNDWYKAARIFKDICRFDQFKFIVTINEYEYYQIEQDSLFLERYCIENLSPSIFKNCLNIDEINNTKDVVGKILSIDYCADTRFKTDLYTPQEAIYYGECVKDEQNVAPPSSYYEYFEKIVRWKEEQIESTKALNEVLNDIVSQKNSLIETKADVTPFRNVQLLTIETQSSIFSTLPLYHLRIFPYWAAKIVGYDTSSIMEYSDGLKEYLVSCYIFRTYVNSNFEREDIRCFFADLYDKGFLDYALFCAHKADIPFWRGLKDFVLGVEVNSPRLCYAILRFVDYCSLKVSEKFAIFIHIAEKLKEYGLMDLYGRVLKKTLDSMSKADSLRKDMRILVPCDVDDINQINGYKAGDRYMKLIGNPSARELTLIIVQYIQQNKMENIIETGENRSFLDYFLRKCFEYYIGHHKMVLQSTYDELRKICNYRPPIGPFVKRNLTCAAGNLFENRIDSEYEEEYIAVVKWCINKPDIQDRLTAWFLISNSVSFDKSYDKIELNPKLNKLLETIMKDREVMNIVGDKIDEFLMRIHYNN